MIYFRCTACGQAHESMVQLPKDVFDASDIEDLQETCPVERRLVIYSKWLMFWQEPPGRGDGEDAE